MVAFISLKVNSLKYDLLKYGYSNLFHKLFVYERH